MSQDIACQKDHGVGDHPHVRVRNNTFLCRINKIFILFKMLVIDCKHPGSIENGRVIIMNDTTTYNSAAEYHCVPHFQRIGSYMRKCLDDGQWSGEQPYCQCKY